MRRSMRQIGRRLDSRERAEVMIEMRLIEVTGIQRNPGPCHASAPIQMVQSLLKSTDAAKCLGRETGLIAKNLNESLGAEGDLFRERRDGCDMRLAHDSV